MNVNGVLNATHAALPHVVRAAADAERGVADIVTISSLAGRPEQVRWQIRTFFA